MNTKVKKTKTSKSVALSNPIAINRTLNKKYSYILLHPSTTQKGYYSFTVFWNPDRAVNQGVPVGKSFCNYKTKQKCVTAIKKLTDVFPATLTKLNHCCDQFGKDVDIEIKYDIKKLL